VPRSGGASRGTPTSKAQARLAAWTAFGLLDLGRSAAYCVLLRRFGGYWLVLGLDFS
jgi:hypothetical protein